ncbi:MAG: carbonic anhydrase [Sporolactobacillus sp.]
MAQLEDMLAFNRRFVEEKAYQPYCAGSRPMKKMTIVTCMDCRLIELLPRALDLANGDAIIVKSAGAVVDEPYGAVMKSVLVSLYELGSKAVYIIGHSDCGMHQMSGAKISGDIRRRAGETALKAAEQQCGNLQGWLNGFESLEEAVKASAEMVRSHPLLPPQTPVYALTIDPVSGKLTLVR